MLCNNEFLKVNLVSKYNEGKMLHLMMLMMMMMMMLLMMTMVMMISIMRIITKFKKKAHIFFDGP